MSFSARNRVYGHGACVHQCGAGGRSACGQRGEGGLSGQTKATGASASEENEGAGQDG